MPNNEIMNINKNNIFYKIKTIFLNIKSKLFEKNNKKEIKNIQKEDIARDEFHEGIKVQDFEKIENTAEKEKFIKELIKNKENLNLLSIERLEKIVEYNDEIIKKNEEKIRKLKMET